MDTALLHALRYGRLDLLLIVDFADLLLSAGADINARTVSGFTALHFAACQSDSDDTSAILLRRGAAKDALTNLNASPLFLAAQRGNLAARRTLLAAGADTSVGVVSVLEIATIYSQIEVIRELVRHVVDIDAAPGANGSTALHWTARLSEAGAIDALVEPGASVDPQASEWKTPLHHAVVVLSLKALHALLCRGASVLARPVRVSQEYGADQYIHNDPPLHCAARKGGIEGAAEAVDLLLKWGADESERDRDGNTAAEAVGADAATENSLAADADCVRELLENASADRAWRRRGLLL